MKFLGRAHNITPDFARFRDEPLWGAVPFACFAKGMGFDFRYEKQTRAPVWFRPPAFHHLQLLPADAVARLASRAEPCQHRTGPLPLLLGVTGHVKVCVGGEPSLSNRSKEFTPLFTLMPSAIPTQPLHAQN